MAISMVIIDTITEAIAGVITLSIVIGIFDTQNIVILPTAVPDTTATDIDGTKLRPGHSGRSCHRYLLCDFGCNPDADLVFVSLNSEPVSAM